MTFDPVISLRQWQAAITTYLKVFFHIPFKDQYQLLQERGETENQILVCGLVCPEQSLRQEAKHIKTCETSVPGREKAQRKCTECREKHRVLDRAIEANTHRHTPRVGHSAIKPCCLVLYCHLLWAAVSSFRLMSYFSEYLLTK